MSRGRLLFVLCLASLAGCSSELAPPSPVVGPHGGPLATLPNDLGFGEVVFETDPKAKARELPRLAVYFLQKDIKTAITTLPSTATVKLMQPGGESASYTLKAQPKLGDPASNARFASEPVKEAADQLVGQLELTISGQTASLPFAGR